MSGAAVSTLVPLPAVQGHAVEDGSMSVCGSTAAAPVGGTPAALCTPTSSLAGPASVGWASGANCGDVAAPPTTKTTINSGRNAVPTAAAAAPTEGNSSNSASPTLLLHDTHMAAPSVNGTRVEHMDQQQQPQPQEDLAGMSVRVSRPQATPPRTPPLGSAVAPSSLPPWVSTGTFAERYVCLGPLGSGAHSTVYRCAPTREAAAAAPAVQAVHRQCIAAFAGGEEGVGANEDALPATLAVKIIPLTGPCPLVPLESGGGVGCGQRIPTTAAASEVTTTSGGTFNPQEPQWLHALRHHPNVVRLVDVFFEPSCCYIVTELLGGGELFAIVDGRPQCSRRRRRMVGATTSGRGKAPLPPSRIEAVEPSPHLLPATPVDAFPSTPPSLPSPDTLSATIPTTRTAAALLTTATAAISQRSPVGLSVVTSAVSTPPPIAAPHRPYFATEPEVAAVMVGLLRALAAMHALGVCHRDVKLENIMLDDDDDDHQSSSTPPLSSQTSLGQQTSVQLGQQASCAPPPPPPQPSRLFPHVKLIDFGFAKAVHSSRMRTCCGSPHYVAPEMLRAARAQSAGGLLPLSQQQSTYGLECDLWSAGVVLYVLLFGAYPFHHERKAMWYQRVLRGAYDVPCAKATRIVAHSQGVFGESATAEEVTCSEASSTASATHGDCGDSVDRPAAAPPTLAASPAALDLLARLLEVDPRRRATAEEALAHRWCSLASASPREHASSPHPQTLQNDGSHSARSSGHSAEQREGAATGPAVASTLGYPAAHAAAVPCASPRTGHDNGSGSNSTAATAASSMGGGEGGRMPRNAATSPSPSPPSPLSCTRSNGPQPRAVGNKPMHSPPLSTSMPSQRHPNAPKATTTTTTTASTAAESVSPPRVLFHTRPGPGPSDHLPTSLATGPQRLPLSPAAAATTTPNPDPTTLPAVVANVAASAPCLRGIAALALGPGSSSSATTTPSRDVPISYHRYQGGEQRRRGSGAAAPTTAVEGDARSSASSASSLLASLMVRAASEPLPQTHAQSQTQSQHALPAVPCRRPASLAPLLPSAGTTNGTASSGGNGMGMGTATASSPPPTTGHGFGSPTSVRPPHRTGPLAVPAAPRRPSLSAASSPSPSTPLSAASPLAPLPSLGNNHARGIFPLAVSPTPLTTTAAMAATTGSAPFLSTPSASSSPVASLNGASNFAQTAMMRPRQTPQPLLSTTATSNHSHNHSYFSSTGSIAVQLTNAGTGSQGIGAGGAVRTTPPASVGSSDPRKTPPAPHTDNFTTPKKRSSTTTTTAGATAVTAATASLSEVSERESRATFKKGGRTGLDRSDAPPSDPSTTTAATTTTTATSGRRRDTSGHGIISTSISTTSGNSISSSSSKGVCAAAGRPPAFTPPRTTTFD